METCRHFGTCGGCAHLDIPYSEELAKKELALRETLASYGSLLEGIIPAPSPMAYRNKMEFAFGDECKDGRLALGIRKRRSFYEVATIEECALVPEDFKRIAICTQDYFRETGEAFFHRKRHIGSLRHLVLRRGEFTGELLVNLSTTSGLNPELSPLITRLRGLALDGHIVGILHSIHDGVADTVKDEDTRILWGRDYFRERICNLDFNVSAYSFFQTNSAGTEKLYEVIRGMAKGDKPALAYDLYCGTGTIAQILSPLFDKVIGVELNPDAIKSAKKNAELNGITNCEFYTGDVGGTEGRSQRAEGRKTVDARGFVTGGTSALDDLSCVPDVVVVDPPRDGLHPKALAKLIALAPPRLIYVACKPASLVRDLAPLTDAGYVPQRAVGVDLFPRTPHLEVVMLMCRENTDSSVMNNSPSSHND